MWESSWQAHSHCSDCVIPEICKYLCNQKDSCALVKCPENCGVTKIHQCKLADHLEEICPFAKVPCINATFGCPLVFPRCARAHHLLSCPASSVVCSAVWNRWPTCSHARIHLKSLAAKSWSHFALPENYYSAPLDVAFALRDQEIVIDSFRVPKKTRKVFCDEWYFHGHPLLPVPIPKLDTECKSLSSDRATSVSVEEFSNASALWNKNNNPAGLTESILKELLSQETKIEDASLKSTIEDFNQENESSSNSGTESSGSENQNDCFDIVDEKTFEVSCGLCKNLLSPFEHDKLGSYGGVETKKRKEEKASNLNPSSQASTVYSEFGLHLNVSPEFYSSYQRKPRVTYSFCCSQTLHRKEYHHHYRDVHCEIVCGLDGWLFHRCPMFTYGCPYFEMLRSPTFGSSQEQAGVLFSHTVDSFGLSVGSWSLMPYTILDIPFDILCKIAEFLDGFTLNSLSLSCKALRCVAESQLKSKGLVEYKWTKVRTLNGSVEWREAKKRWFFSKVFSEISGWKIHTSGISEHMKVCQYYERLKCEKPFKLADFEISVQQDS